MIRPANLVASTLVQCADQACGWTGRRRPYYEQRGRHQVTVWPTSKPCPNCGSEVAEAPESTP